MFILYIKDSIEEEDPSIEDFAITKINQVYGGNSFFTSLRELKEKLQDSDVYTPIEVMKYTKCSDKRQNFHRLIKNIPETGFQALIKILNYTISNCHLAGQIKPFILFGNNKKRITRRKKGKPV